MVQATEKVGMIDVQRDGKGTRGSFVGFANHLPVKLYRIEANAVVEVVAFEHSHRMGGEDGEQKEARPESGFPVVPQGRLRSQQRFKDISVTIFILTPALEEAK